MANGVAVRFAPDPTPASPQEDIRTALGQAMADATEAFGAGLADFDAGGRLSDANRALGGTSIAAVVELQLAHFGAFDFAGVAVAAGRRVLLERHAEKLCQHLGTDAGIDDTFDMLLSQIITVATKVAAVEMAYRSN